ncbi:hypothetical protein V6N13_053234 [Hibiscus sabdariffa]
MGNDTSHDKMPPLNVACNKGLMTAFNQPQVSKNAAYRKSNPPKKSKEVARGDDKAKLTHVSIDQDVVIISQDNAGNSYRHTTITLMEKRYETPRSSGGKIVKARGYVGRVSLEGHRRVFSLRKPLEIPSRSQPSLHDWMSNLSSQWEVPSSSENPGADGFTCMSQLGDGSDPSVSEHETAHDKEPLELVGADLRGDQETMEQ